MQELHDLSKPFKYVVSCVIVQKNGAGFHIGHSAYWDISNDNICQVNVQLGGVYLWEREMSGKRGMDFDGRSAVITPEAVYGRIRDLPKHEIFLLERVHRGMAKMSGCEGHRVLEMVVPPRPLSDVLSR